jgi:ATP-binding cassette subfamily B protein
MEAAVKQAPKSKAHILSHLFHYVRGYWKDTILTWIFVLIESVCEVLVVYYMQFLIDGVHAQNQETIYLYSGVIAGIAIAAAVFGILAGLFAASAAAGFGKNLREAMFVQIQKYLLQEHR